MLTISSQDRKRVAILTTLLLLLVATVFSACSGPDAETVESPEEVQAEPPAEENPATEESVAPLEEEPEFEIAVERPPQGAGSTPEETWNAYLRDNVALNVARVQDKLTLFERYQNPVHLELNTGGLIEDVDLVEDRTVFDKSNQDTFATATTDFDVRITFANGDIERRNCQIAVQIEQNPEDKLWYIINPQVFAAESMCIRS